MKTKLLIPVLILITAPLTTNAQNFEACINGGVSFHSLPAKNDYTHEDKSKGSYALSFRANLLLEHSSIGVGFEMCNLEEYNYLIPPYTMRVYNYIAKPLITPFISYNRLFHFDESYFYIGAMGGPAIAKVGINDYTYTNPYGNITGYTTKYNSVLGINLGLQTGVLLTVSNRLGINLEAAMRYASYSYKDPNNNYLDNPYNYHIFYFPMTVGVRYRI